MKKNSLNNSSNNNKSMMKKNWYMEKILIKFNYFIPHLIKQPIVFSPHIQLMLNLFLKLVFIQLKSLMNLIIWTLKMFGIMNAQFLLLSVWNLRLSNMVHNLLRLKIKRFSLIFIWNQFKTIQIKYKKV